MIIRLILTFAAAALAQYMLYRGFAMRRFKYSCSLSRHKVVEGDTINLAETIENGGFLPLLWLRIETRFHESLLFLRNDNTRVSAGVFHRSVLSAPPFRRARRTYKVTCSKRGYYRLGATYVSAGDLLGMVSKRKEFASDTELHVYPVPAPLGRLQLPARSWQGDMVVRRFILPDPFMPAGVRDYVPGDPMSRINWKASAKTGKLAVHRHEYTANPKLEIIFNVDQWVYTGSTHCEELEQGISLLAAIVDLAIANGLQAGLRTNSFSARDGGEVTVPAASGRAQREKLFSAAAEMRQLYTRSCFMLLREAAETVRDSDVLLVTCYMTKEAAVEVGALRDAGNKVEILYLPGTKPV